MIADQPVLQPGEPTGREEPRRKRWTREEYYRMAELGLFEPGARVELIDGEILEMSPSGPPHGAIITCIGELLRSVLPAGYHIRTQLPISIGEATDPDPDLAVVGGKSRDYSKEHPSTAALIVEVSDTSLAYDRGAKAGLYARAGIPEYWIADLRHNRLEIRREPVEMPGEPFGSGYRSVTTHLPGDIVACLLAPDRPLPVRDLLLEAPPDPPAIRRSTRKKS